MKNRIENDKFMQYDAGLTNINNYQIEMLVKFNSAGIIVAALPNVPYTFKGNLDILFIGDRSLQTEGVDITRLAWRN